MGKVIRLNEGDLRKIIQEELSISREVAIIARRIEQKIEELISNGVTEYRENILEDLSFEFRSFSFNTSDEVREWQIEELRKPIDNREYINGYSYTDKCIYISIIKINGVYEYYDLSDAIYHEVEHYFQCKKRGKDIFDSKYQKTQKYRENSNVIYQTFAYFFYYTRKTEIESFIHGAFGLMNRFDIQFRTINDMINGTKLKEIVDTYEKLENIFNSINFDSPSIITIINRFVFDEMIPVNYSRDYFIRKIEKAKKYFYVRVGRLWSLYLKYNMRLIGYPDEVINGALENKELFERLIEKH